MNHKPSLTDGNCEVDVVDPAQTPELLIGFPQNEFVDVRAVDDRRWDVLAAIDYQAKHDRYTVPKGERTDFASVPRPFVWFIPTYGRYTKAAILHDHLCRLAREGTFNRRDADGVFRQAMRALAVPFLRRWIMWAAVRWGAIATREGRRDWIKDAWLVLPITLVVVPIVAPAALLIVATLGVWYLAEWLTWVPLAVVRRERARRGLRAKQVNAPEFTLNL
jgi:hypothetical protein